MNNAPTVDVNTCTIMLASGDLDKALVAFEIATGLAAMGKEVNLWFAFYGVNCVKKPRSMLSLSRLIPRRLKDGRGRNARTDTVWQHLLGIVNYDGAAHVPLSQLNMMGMGPMVLNRIFKRKGMATLAELINYAIELNVNFKICQVCIDVMGLDVDNDLIINAEVSGVTGYVVDTQKSHYNTVI